MKNLSDLKPGSTAEVVSIGANDLADRMMEMNLLPGKKITYLFKAPAGDPIAIDIDGYTLSLRLSEAALIEVR